MAKVLIIGMGRAGKSWAGSGLGLASQTTFVDEPDNQFLVPFAFGVKRRMHQRLYPALDPRESAPSYEALWQFAFGNKRPRPTSKTMTRLSKSLLSCGGGRLSRLLRCQRAITRAILGHRPSVRLILAEATATPYCPPAACANVLVGSAYSHLSAEWIAEHAGCEVVIVRRNLGSLLATWIDQQWLSTGSGLREVDPNALQTFAADHAAEPPVSASILEQTAWLFGFLSWHLRALSLRHPTWPVVDYEELVQTPELTFPRLARELGLLWDGDSEHALEGLRDSIASRMAGLHPHLAASAYEVLTRVLESFDLQDWGPTPDVAGSQR
jgi:hypothetical protein